MVTAQIIEQLVKIIDGGDASSQEFSINIIGQLARYGLLSWLSIQYYNSYHVLDHLQSSLQINVTPSLVNNFNHKEQNVQCSSINCVTQYAKHGIQPCLVQFVVPHWPADVLDASRWYNVFKALLPLFCHNSPDAGVSGSDNDDVQQACLHCISQSFERGMIPYHGQTHF